jgi:putative membrane protein
MTSRADSLLSPTRRTGLIAVAGGLLLAACGQMPGSMMSGKPDPDASAGMSGAALDTFFVTRAMQSDMLEITSSRLALTRTTNPQIHRFARQMLDDHTANGMELRDLAARLDLASTPPAPLPADEAKIRQLQAADDGQFETLYIQMIGLEAHTEAVNLFRREASQGGNTELRAFAARKLPALEQHLAMARTMSASAK